MEFTHEEHLQNFESICRPLPEESDWEESTELKDMVHELLTCGFENWNGGTLWLREIADGYDYDGWLCHLNFYDEEDKDFHAYGKGHCVADSVFAALIQLEVDLMLRHCE